MQKITLEWLKENGACGGICKDFKKLLGDKEYLTILDVQYRLIPQWMCWFAQNTKCVESLNILSNHRDGMVVYIAKETLKELGV